MMTSGNSRVVRRKLADGDISMSLSVVKNIRLNGRPNHLELAKIGTFRQSEFTARAEEFWSIVDEKLSDLVKTNKLWSNDRLKIEKQFNAVIPRPASVPKTVEPESNLELMQSVIAQIAEKAEHKLKREFGISL